MKKDNILMELLTGILFFGVILQVICLVAFQKDVYNAVGLWAGIAVALFMAIHMKRSIEDSLDIGEENATAYARNAYAKRTGISLAIIAVIVCFKLGNPITLVVGIFSLKLSAYLQPFTHKLFLWLQEKKKR